MSLSPNKPSQWFREHSGFVKKWLLSPLLLMLLAYGVVSWLDSNKPEAKQRESKIKKVKVIVFETEPQSTQLTGYSQGQVEPIEHVNLKAEVAGQIRYVSANFVSGGIIHKGDLLIEIVADDYELNVISKRAKVAQSLQQLATAKAESEQAQSELASLNRQQASDLAKGIPQLKQAQAALDAAKAELAQAELDLSRTKIYAPFDGRVESRAVSKANWVNRGTELARLFATDVMEVRLSMAVEQFTQIGLPLAYYSDYNASNYRVHLYSEMGEFTAHWQGKIVRTEAVMDERTRTIYAVAQVQDSYTMGETPLLKGLFVRAEIYGRMLDNATILPKAALRNNQQLWLVDNDSRLRVVTADIVQRTPDSFIVQNLPAKTKVITSALAIPTDGLPVKSIMAHELEIKSRVPNLSKEPKIENQNHNGGVKNAL